HHQLDGYLAKIIAAGMRAAVCEQVEDPKKAKGLVKRELTRVVTPGTVTDDALLDPRESNYLAAICLATSNRRAAGVTPLRKDRGGGSFQDDSASKPQRADARRSPNLDDRVGIAWIDLSTGSFQATVAPATRLADELARIQP